jgi:hypothetical protein
MKRQLFISILIILSFTLNLKGQNSEINRWSVSFSFSPKLDISKYGPGYNYQSYYKSFTNMFDYQINKHFSFGFGISGSFDKREYSGPVFNGVDYDVISYTYKILLLEFPVQLNYYFIDTAKRINPYFKFGLKNSLYRRDESASLPISSYPYTRYFLLMDFGLGSNFKISDRLSFTYEASIGFGLIYQRSNYVYLEGQIGIKYALR